MAKAWKAAIILGILAAAAYFFFGTFDLKTGAGEMAGVKARYGGETTLVLADQIPAYRNDLTAFLDKMQARAGNKDAEALAVWAKEELTLLKAHERALAASGKISETTLTQCDDAAVNGGIALLEQKISAERETLALARQLEQSFPAQAARLEYTPSETVQVLLNQDARQIAGIRNLFTGLCR